MAIIQKKCYYKALFRVFILFHPEGTQMVRIYYLAIMLSVIGSINSMSNEEVAQFVIQNKQYELSRMFVQSSGRCPQRLKALVKDIMIDTGQRHLVDYYLDDSGKVTAISIYSAQRNKTGLDTFNLHCVPGRATHNTAKL